MVSRRQFAARSCQEGGLNKGNPRVFGNCYMNIMFEVMNALADLVCETAGELVAGTGWHDTREGRASADVAAWLAGTEWGP